MTTEAGKRHIDDLRLLYQGVPLIIGKPEEVVAAIEAEAVAAERARIAEAVRKLGPFGRIGASTEADQLRHAVLALLEEQPNGSPPSVTDRLDNGTNWEARQ